VADDEIGTEPSGISATRMEAFSDAVLAIAITLLVLDLGVRPPGSAVKQFFNAWPSYLAYVVSFFTIGAAWLAHHSLTARLSRVNEVFLRLNLLFLLIVGFLPFPTRLMADSLNQGADAERLAAVVYGVTLMVIRLAFAVMDWYSRRAHLVVPTIPDPDLEAERKKLGFVISAYLFTIVLSLVAPLAAIVLYLAIAIVLVLPRRSMNERFFRSSD